MGGNAVTRPRGLLRLWMTSTICCVVAATTYLNSEARRIQHAFVQSTASPSHIFYALDERIPGTQAYERRVFWTVKAPILMVSALSLPAVACLTLWWIGWSARSSRSQEAEANPIGL